MLLLLLLLLLLLPYPRSVPKSEIADLRVTCRGILPWTYTARELD